MRIVLVGRKENRRAIKWAHYFVVGFCLCLVLGTGIGCVFRLLSGQWNHGAVFYGIALGLGVMAIALRKGLATPIDELPPLE